MKIVLSPDLEKALLRAIAEGVCPADVVVPEELSKKAKVIYGSIKHLLDKKARPPLKPASILLTAASLYGAPKDLVKDYLRSFKEFETGSEIQTILRTAREKATLVSLINEAGGQLAAGDLRVSDLARLLNRKEYVEQSAPFSDEISDVFPKPPSGIKIQSLPVISETTRGIFGVWIVGGEPGTGKSTLSWQLALDVGSRLPVLYYDLDGTGRDWFRERTRYIVNDSIKQFKKLTARLHYRENIRTLDEDLVSIKAPAMLVIDSVQTLPTSIKFSKQSLDEWIKKFKDLSQRGYALLLISEKPRSQYGEANVSGYKGSGDLEYGGSVCLQLLGEEDDEDTVQCHVVKNRHGKGKGHIINLERDAKRVFWFAEQEVDSE